MSQTQQEERKEYLDERKLLVRAEHEVAQRLDKSLLTLSGGALGFSITFARQMAGDPVVHLWLLWTSWICFGLAIIVMLFSLWTSQCAFARQREIIDANYESECDQEERNVPRVWTGRLTVGALLFFTIGVGFLAWFALSNVNSS